MVCGGWGGGGLTRGEGLLIFVVEWGGRGLLLVFLEDGEAPRRRLSWIRESSKKDY